MNWAASPILFALLAGVAAVKAAPARPDPSFTSLFQRTNGIVATDGALSVPLSDGRVLWLFGDSHVDDYDPKTKTIPCLFQVRNAAFVHVRTNLSEVTALIGKSKGFRSLFKTGTDENQWFWPGAGFQESTNVWVYLNALRKSGEGQWGFAAGAHDYFARMSFPDLTVREYVALPSFAGIGFGCGFVEGTNGMLAYGSKRVGMQSRIYAARFPAGQPGGRWEFWNGEGWKGDAGMAAPIAEGASSTVHVCRIRSKYLIVSSQFSVACDQGREIYAMTSDRPTGPFSPRRTIFTIDDRVDGHVPFFYFPVTHPEFIDAEGNLLLTYSINGYEPCLKACVKGRGIPDHYRPRAARIPLRLIDPEF